MQLGVFVVFPAVLVAGFLVWVWGVCVSSVQWWFHLIYLFLVALGRRRCARTFL